MNDLNEKIKQLIKEKYNGYRGRMLKPIGRLHAKLYRRNGAEWFYEFLKQRDAIPKYEPNQQIIALLKR